MIFVGVLPVWIALEETVRLLLAQARSNPARLCVSKAIWAIAHRLLCVLWRILHPCGHYHEHAPLAERADRLALKAFSRVSPIFPIFINFRAELPLDLVARRFHYSVIGPPQSHRFSPGRSGREPERSFR